MALPPKVKAIVDNFSTTIGTLEITASIRAMMLYEENGYQNNSDFSDAISDAYMQQALATLFAADVAGFKEFNREEVVERFRRLIDHESEKHKNLKKTVNDIMENADEQPKRAGSDNGPH